MNAIRGSWQRLCNINELAEGKIITALLSEHRFIVARLPEKGGDDTGNQRNRVVVFRDRCSHQDVPLSAFGRIDDRCEHLSCLAHGARFRLIDGARVEGPRCADLDPIPVMLVDDLIMIDWPRAES